jgi:hypothetical protein
MGWLVLVGALAAIEVTLGRIERRRQCREFTRVACQLERSLLLNWPGAAPVDATFKPSYIRGGRGLIRWQLREDDPPPAGSWPAGIWRRAGEARVAVAEVKIPASTPADWIRPLPPVGSPP